MAVPSGVSDTRVCNTSPEGVKTADLVFAQGGVHHPVEVHGGGIEAPYRWGDETPVSLVDRLPELDRLRGRYGAPSALAR